MEYEMAELAAKSCLPESRSYRRQVATVCPLREILTMTRRQMFCAIFLCGYLATAAIAQQHAVPDSQFGTVSGTVTDVNGDIIPGADVLLESSVTGQRRAAVSDDGGSYTFGNLRPGVTYHLTVSAPGFVTWTSPPILVNPGQFQFVTESRLELAGGATSVTVYASPEHIAIEQVKTEERQRVFGIFPDFYVVFNHNTVPLTSKLKFKLALRAATDPVIFAAAAFIAGTYQAGDTPNYSQGLRGYGQRMGALYANGFTDIMVGEAILPSLLHQDPRYFYQGIGTTKSRIFHALSSPFICKGDNGKWEPNYSSIGGDLTSGAVSNLYYPQSNRGPGIVFENALVTTGGRMANALVQEFILRRFTSNAKNRIP